MWKVKTLKHNIIVAQTAGFCFGVDRAVKMVYEQLHHGKVATYGPIIHNPSVIADLESKGARIVCAVDELVENECLVLRSHGVKAEVYAELALLGLPFLDATCPFVARIHKIVATMSATGYFILLAGDATHPEVEGIVSEISGKSFVFDNEATLKLFFEKNIEINKKKVAIIAQTTYNIKMWDKCIEMVKSFCPQVEVFYTICDATSKRQFEAEQLARSSDLMVVVGGRDSSNTIRLAEVCAKFCDCVHVETAADLYDLKQKLSGASSIGITAGASTPAYIIEEVQCTMSEILDILDEDFNFEEELDKSFKKIYTGNRVKGYITAVNANEAIVDVGTKHTGYVPLSELTDDPNLRPCDVVSVGDEIDLIVVKINDQEGIVNLSKKRIDAMVGFESVLKAKDDGSVLQGTVVDVIKGGILVVSNGARVFIPASQATLRRDDKLEEMLKKTVSFKILEVNEQRGRAVGSIKAVSKESRDVAEKKFWETVKVGDTFTGEAKSITNYGVFVDLGGIDGMVHISELSWNRIKHPSEVVATGDMLEVYVKELDVEKNRISLGYRKTSENPWGKFAEEYNAGDVVKATIVSITPFGAFAQIVPGVDGLIHISQISKERITNAKEVLSVGQVVDAKITEIDTEKKRISLSIKELLEDAPEEKLEIDNKNITIA